jgi:hypothetical protein
MKGESMNPYQEKKMTSLSTSPILQRVASVIALAILAACSGGGSSSGADNLVVNGDVPLVYVNPAAT